MKQFTINQAISLSGKGLHTGANTTITLHPAPANSGIQFKRIDLPSQPIIKADIQNIGETQRSTIIKTAEASISTIEHLMAACFALGVDNLLIDINGPEVPILDGSSLPFVNALKDAGLQEQELNRVYFKIQKPIHIQHQGSEISIFPADEFEITSLIDFNSKVVGTQFAQLKDLNAFETEIAPARTFVFLHEIMPLFQHGLIKGGDLDSAVVFVEHIPDEATLDNMAKQLGKDKIEIKGGTLNDSLRFDNEPARHKLLDVLGDLYLSGVHIIGRIIAHKPGHTINALATKAIKEAYKEHLKNAQIPSYDPSQKPLMDINDITERIQHRYPFLLLDKVMEMDDEHIVAVKNVTMNEPFFQGHFPGNPVMPGVLQIEAMAQAGGIFVFNLTKVENPLEWDTYFLRINNARFREKVLPGDTLVMRLDLLSPIRRGLCEMRARAYVGNRLVAEAELLAQILKRPIATA